MERLPNEVLQLILNEIAKPSAFVVLNRKLRAFASDAYVRARYFLARHGKAQALFYALGRGNIVTQRVIEVLLSCGAHVSRHLIQLAVQHYHHGHVSFISRPWVRNLSFIVFARFLSLACARFDGEFKLPSKKDPDDGTKFQRWIDERKRKIGSDEEKEARGVVEELIERWKFQPVCDKDPALAHFALTLAVEPKLLALAVANGYGVDPVYRDYIFRRLLTQPSEASQSTDAERKDELLSTLREVCKSRESSLFLSRTVAAEICLEAKANKVAYDLLKTLDRDGLLRFDLITLIQELIKSFVTKRSITDSSTAAAIHHLFNDLPAHAANDAGVRQVVLLTIFATSLTAHIANARLLKLGLAPDPVDAVPGVRQVYRAYNTADTLAPISRAELVSVLLSPFVHTHHAIATYARFYAFYPNKTVEGMLEEVALACLKLPGKGEMLEMLTRRYTGLRHIIGRAIETYGFELDDLPAHDASDDVKRRFRVALGRRVDDAATSMSDSYLGDLTHETLSESFARDVVEERKPWQRYRGARAQRGPQLERKKDVDAKTKDVGKATKDNATSEAPLSTARWVIDTFGSMSAQAAVFADHVVANWLDERKPEYWARGPVEKDEGTLEGVPMTMKHWEILARLGRQPSARMVERIAEGETFYEYAQDYLAPLAPVHPLELESEPPVEVDEANMAIEVVAPPARPRRAAAQKIKSYVELESDDDEDTTSDVGASSVVGHKATAAVGSIVKVKVEEGASRESAEVKTELVEPAIAVRVEPAADDSEDCACARHCDVRDCHGESGSEDEGIPIECCKLGLTCPERLTLFATPASRRAASEHAKQMRTKAEEMRHSALRDKRMRALNETLAVERKETLERVEKAVRLTKEAGWRRNDWVEELCAKIQKCDEEIEKCADEEKRLQEYMKKLESPTYVAEKEEQLSLWESALSALHKEESQKLADIKKRLGLKRIFKSPFVLTLDWNLWKWRDSLLVRKDKRKREEASVQVPTGSEGEDESDDDYGVAKTKRRKLS